MTTIHEAYQFLIKKYVDGHEDATKDMFLDMEELKAKHAEKMAKKAQDRKELQEQEEHAKSLKKLETGRKSR